MTNREAFNQYIRMNVEKQIRYMEAMSDKELVQYTIDHRDYRIAANIGNKLSYFKAITAGMPVGSKDEVIDWLDEEAPETIPWEKML